MSAPDPSSSAAPAAAPLPRTGSRRATAPPRPDPAEQLLAAVRGRDSLSAAGLLQQWVHRRGVASLAPFRLRLAALEGEEACEWLQVLIDDPSAASPRAVLPVPVAPAAPELELPPPQPGPEAIGRISSSVDQAVAAYWQETSPTPVPDPPAPVVELSLPVAEFPVLDQELPALTEELPLAPALGLGRRVAAAGRQSLVGLRTLVRDCLDEAIGGLGGGSAAPVPPVVVAQPPSSVAASGAAGATPPLPSAVPPLPSAVTPLPAAAAPLPWGSRNAGGNARPRQAPAAPGNRPAPAPAALADLRGWLPDSGDQGTTAG